MDETTSPPCPCCRRFGTASPGRCSLQAAWGRREAWRQSWRRRGMGTAFLARTEASPSPAARSRLFAATDTVYGRVFDIVGRAGWPREVGERAQRDTCYDRWSRHEDELANDAAAALEMAGAGQADAFDTACLDAEQGVAACTGR
jgi:hypothetical protein